MSNELISLSPDLKSLVDKGYEVAIKHGFLLILNVPYVNADKKVRRGILVSALDLNGDRTIQPRTHVAMFVGEYPCDQLGRGLAE